MKFKDSLRKERNKHDLSQESLAERMLVSRQTISKWENGASYPSTEHILMLTKIFNCSVDDFINGEINNRQLANTELPTVRKKYVCWMVGVVTTFLMMVFGFVFWNSTNMINDGMFDDLKTVAFDEIVDGAIDNAVVADGYMEKKIVGYGVAEENGTFYVKCNLYNDIGNSCSAIIYFCKNENGFYCECQYLNDPEYVPDGEYYEVG